MRKYIVEITETLQRQIELEAEDRNQAEHIAKLLYDNEKIVLDSEDFIKTEFSVFNLPSLRSMEER